MPRQRRRESQRSRGASSAFCSLDHAGPPPRIDGPTQSDRCCADSRSGRNAWATTALRRCNPKATEYLQAMVDFLERKDSDAALKMLLRT